MYSTERFAHFSADRGPSSGRSELKTSIPIPHQDKRFLVARHAIKGGETRVFDAHGTQGVRFTLQEPWSALLLDDERVVHESTPIQPIAADRTGHRDTLVITLRADGFQGPDARS